MSTAAHNCSAQRFIVVHPLDDAPEQKCSADHLDKIAMSPSVRISLIILRGYLILVSTLCLYHVLSVSGLLSKGN